MSSRGLLSLRYRDATGAESAGRAGGAQAQLRHHGSELGDVFTADLREQDVHGALPQRREILMNCGQRRPDVSGDGYVIETDDADLARHLDAGIPEPVHEADRHQIVRCEDGGEIPATHELSAGEVTEIRGPIAPDRRERRQVSLPERVEIAAHARFRLNPVLGSCQVENVAVSQ